MTHDITTTQDLPTIYVLNGANLNLLGQREPHIYGHTTLEQIHARCLQAAQRLNVGIDFRQSNHEGQLVDWIQEARQKAQGIVINPAGYSFTSVTILDALKASELPIVEVHLSNIHRREPIYHKSLVSLAARGVICGLGPIGYEFALAALAEQFSTPNS
jgi:3-dehydroquinate dehydratase II